MTDLPRVSFKKGREYKPRLSPPRVPGRRHERYWSDDEKAIVKRYYPDGGTAACLAHLSPHRTPSGVYRVANKLGLTTPYGKADYKGTNGHVEPPPGFDDALREFYQNGDGKKRGECDAFADRWKLPRWWVTKRATKLGLTLPHKKEPPWTTAEDALLKKVPLHDPFRCSDIFREHGFARSPSAIMARAKRKDLSRRFREGLSATEVGKILGVDNKTSSQLCVTGELKAEKRADNRLPQQGGSRWIVKPADLRRYVLDHLERIDLRKVDKFAFVQLIAAEPLVLADAVPLAPAPAPAIADPRPATRSAKRSRRADPDATRARQSAAARARWAAQKAFDLAHQLNTGAPS